MTCISKAIYRGNCSLPRDDTWIRGLGEKIVSDIHKFDYRDSVDNTRFVFAPGSSYMCALRVHHRSHPRELYIVYSTWFTYMYPTCIYVLHVLFRRVRVTGIRRISSKVLTSGSKHRWEISR